jgi:hypothetical protein
MLKEKQGFGDIIQATLGTSGATSESMGIEGVYHVECRDAEGRLKWEEGFPNLVNAQGKQLLFNTVFRTAGTYTTVGPFLGLIAGSSLTFAAANTLNSKTWTEFTAYSVGGNTTVRGTAVFPVAASSSGDSPSNVTTITANAITYTITGAGGTIGGCFLVTGAGAVSTKSDTNGSLYSAGAFALPRETTVNDTVTVTYTTTATS